MWPLFLCAYRSSVPLSLSSLCSSVFPRSSFPTHRSPVPTVPLFLTTDRSSCSSHCSLCDHRSSIPLCLPLLCALCSSVPTVPLCPLFLCYSLPTVPYCPLFPLRSPFLYTSVPTVPPDLFLCAHASSVLTVPLFPFAHCSSVLTVPPFLSALCPSVLTIPQCPIFLCVHRSSIPLCPSAKATSTGIGVEWARGSQKQSNDNSKVNRTQVIRFQISTSAESNLCSVTTVVETEDQIRRMLLRIKNFLYYCIRYYSSTRNVSIFLILELERSTKRKPIGMPGMLTHFEGLLFCD